MSSEKGEVFTVTVIAFFQPFSVRKDIIHAITPKSQIL